MRLRIKQVTGTSILSGAQMGRRLFATLLAEVGSVASPTVVFLDFEGVDVATASFLREGVFAFRDYCRSSLENAYPVVANAAEAVVEELKYFAGAHGDAMWLCRLDDQGVPSAPQSVGTERLDAGQQAALDFVCRHPGANARQMMTEGDSIGATGWNNRLSALTGKGLIIEERRGKTKFFRPVLEVS